MAMPKTALNLEKSTKKTDAHESEPADATKSVFSGDSQEERRGRRDGQRTKRQDCFGDLEKLTSKIKKDS